MTDYIIYIWLGVIAGSMLIIQIYLGRILNALKDIRGNQR